MSHYTAFPREKSAPAMRPFVNILLPLVELSCSETDRQTAVKNSIFRYPGGVQAVAREGGCNCAWLGVCRYILLGHSDN